MARDFLRTGGPHKIKRVGRHRYSFSVSVPEDSKGLVGRECPKADCPPGYFKVKPGTGITKNQEVAYCPYCRAEAHPREFATRSQLDYAAQIVKRETVKGVNEMLRESLGLDKRGKRQLGGDMLSLTMEMKPSRLPPLRRPIDEELRRDLSCSNCGLGHAVFGLATWCPDCGSDIFTSHVSEELNVLRKVLAEVPDRRERLGARVAARDVENSLEDLVSLVEAVLKILTRRHLVLQGWDADRLDNFFRSKVKNSYQNLERAASVFQKHIGADLRQGISPSDFERLAQILGKRHPITHNLGVVDRQYLERARAGALEGREVRVTEEEVRSAIESVNNLLAWAHRRLFVDETENSDLQ